MAARAAGARLAHVLLLQRDVAAAARFYEEGLGLRCRVRTPRWAEMDAGGGGVLALKEVATGEACLSVGYTPILSFRVDDLQGTVQRLLGLGARLDGAIRYPPGAGKVAALRGPDGHMLSLHELHPDEPAFVDLDSAERPGDSGS